MSSECKICIGCVAVLKVRGKVPESAVVSMPYVGDSMGQILGSLWGGIYARDKAKAVLVLEAISLRIFIQPFFLSNAQFFQAISTSLARCS